MDLSQAYQQLKVDEESSGVLTVNTLNGSIRVYRLFFDIAAAPGKFQRQMDTLLNGFDGVGAYLDNMLYSSRNEQEYHSRLQTVSQRLEKKATQGNTKCAGTIAFLER